MLLGSGFKVEREDLLKGNFGFNFKRTTNYPKVAINKRINYQRHALVDKTTHKHQLCNLQAGYVSTAFQLRPRNVCGEK